MGDETLIATPDPLASHNSALPRVGRGRLANLAFGSINRRPSEALTTDGLDPGRHLAYLPADVLDLDLSDPAQRQFGDYELLELVGEGAWAWSAARARSVSTAKSR